MNLFENTPMCFKQTCFVPFFSPVCLFVVAKKGFFPFKVSFDFSKQIEKFEKSMPRNFFWSTWFKNNNYNNKKYNFEKIMFCVFIFMSQVCGAPFVSSRS